MKKFTSIIFFCLTLLSWQNYAQQVCGIEDLTTEDAAQIMLGVQSMSMDFVPGNQAISPVGPITVPFQPHIIRNDNGIGGLSPAVVTADIIAAAAHYLPYGIILDIKPILYVDRTDLLTIGANGTEGDNNLPEYNILNHVNAYYIQFIPGSGGYAKFPWNLDYDYITIAGGNVDLTGATTAHEMGHYFGLLHTHEAALGAELVDGSNCGTGTLGLPLDGSGDLLCDTPADPNIWNPNFCAYPGGGATDANGDLYNPDPQQIMSYNTPFACAQNFSADAEERMRFYMGNDFPNTRSYLFSPTAVCMNTTVTINGAETATITGSDVDGGSSDPNGSALTYSVSPSSFTSADAGANTVTLTITNSNGFTATCTATVQVIVKSYDSLDAQAQLDEGQTALFTLNSSNVPNNVTVGYTITGIESDDLENPSDMTGTFTISNDIDQLTIAIAEDLLIEGQQTLTLTLDAVDSEGTAAGLSVDIDIIDTSGVPPSIVCPADIVVDNDSDSCDAIVTFAATDTTGDPTSGITYSQDPGTAFPVGTTTVIATATNSVGTDQCTFTITVNDTENPAIICPVDITTSNDTGDCSAVVTYTTPVGTDNCTGVTTTQTAGLPSGSTFPLGTTTNTFEVTDAAGNTATCSFNVTVNDTEDPTWVIPPSDLTVACDGNGNVSEFDNWLNTTFTGTDNCGEVIISNNSSGLIDACGGTGSETVTFTLTDSNNNSISLDATFTIEDTTAPVIFCPDNLTAFTEDVNCGAIVFLGDPIAIEECGSVIVYQTAGLDSGSVFPVGDTIIEFTAEDECGNIATCEFIVTVIDNDAPEAICQDLTVILDDTGNATITADQLNFGSNDNCGVESLAIDVDTFDCSNVGANQVTLTVTDIHGNTATCVSTVTVLDNTAPIAVCQDITLELGDDGTVTIDPLAIDGGSSDACGIASYELDIDTLDCSNLGTTTVTLTVTDTNGNQSSCAATVTLEDNSAPVLVCSDVTVELNQDGVALITPSLVADITDNCGTSVVTINAQEVSCADIGTPLTVTVFASDENGNSASCSAVVTVVDLLAPEIVCPDDQVVNLGPDGTYTLGDYIADGSATATDNCTDPVTIFAQDPAAGSVLGFGTQEITFTAEDQYGNVSTCSFELDIQVILGAGDVEDFASLVLYPNPADSKVNLSNPRQIDLNNVTIYDLTGRIVHKVDLSTMGSEIMIDISTLANATYMLVIEGSQGISTKQLIVNN